MELRGSPASFYTSSRNCGFAGYSNYFVCVSSQKASPGDRGWARVGWRVPKSEL